MNGKLFFYTVLFFVLLSCTNTPTPDKDYPILKVSLEETNTSLFDIFEKVEIIPLETIESSLIKDIRKVYYYDGKYYLYDGDMNALFFFNNTGSFIDKIHRIGIGPGEYQYIYDFHIDTVQHQIEMLSPFGAIFCYNFDGIFIKKIDLPNPPPSYWYIRHFDEHNYIFWSPLFPSLNIISKEDGTIKSILYEENDIINAYMGDVFHYDEHGYLYFMRPFLNEVFRVTIDGLEPAYAWDFGKETIDVSKYKFPDTGNVDEDARIFYQMYNEGNISQITYNFVYQFQTDSYYYANMRFAFNKRKHLFYNKTTGKYSLFEKTSEGAQIARPLFVCNDFMISTIDYANKASFANILDGRNKEILDNFKDDDNPCLFKLVFKKQ